MSSADVQNSAAEADVDVLRIENETLKQQLQDAEGEKMQLNSTINELKDQLKSLKSKSISGGDGDSEVMNLKKANSKLEKDLRVLREKYNNQAKVMTRKMNIPSKEIDKTVKEIERLEQQSSRLKICLLDMRSEIESELKSKSKNEETAGAKADVGREPSRSESANHPNGHSTETGRPPNARNSRGQPNFRKPETDHSALGAEAKPEPIAARRSEPEPPLKANDDQSKDISQGFFLLRRMLSMELCSTSELDFHTVDIGCMEIEIWSPSEVDTEWETVELQRGEDCWRQFLPRVKYLKEYIDEGYAAVMQWGELYCNDEKVTKAIQVLDPPSNYSEFRTGDGTIIEKEKATHSFRLFLHPDSPIETCRGYTPILTVLTSCHVLSQDRRRAKYVLRDDSLEAIFEPSALVLIWALHLMNYELDEEHIFVQLNGRKFCDGRTGRLYENESEVYAGYDRNNDKHEWSYLLILLRRGDRVPYFRVPENIPVAAFTRFGLDLEISRGKVFSRIQSNRGLDGTWTITKTISAFDQQLSNTMRMGRPF